MEEVSLKPGTDTVPKA